MTAFRYIRFHVIRITSYTQSHSLSWLLILSSMSVSQFTGLTFLDCSETVLVLGCCQPSCGEASLRSEARLSTISVQKHTEDLFRILRRRMAAESCLSSNSSKAAEAAERVLAPALFCMVQNSCYNTRISHQ